MPQPRIKPLLGHVHRGIHRAARIGCGQRQRIVDAVAHVAHHVAGCLQRQGGGFWAGLKGVGTALLSVVQQGRCCVRPGVIC